MQEHSEGSYCNIHPVEIEGSVKLYRVNKIVFSIPVLVMMKRFSALVVVSSLFWALSSASPSSPPFEFQTSLLPLLLLLLVALLGLSALELQKTHVIAPTEHSLLDSEALYTVLRICPLLLQRAPTSPRG